MSEARDSTTVHAADPAATRAVGSIIARHVRDGDVIALDGPLGAGKTELVRGLAEGMGLDPGDVTSPTFVLMHEYEPQDAASPVLAHIDAYRLEGADGLASLGWQGHGEGLRRGAVTAIEWADRVATALGPDRLNVRIEHAPAGRRITLSPGGTWRARMPALSAELTQRLGSTTGSDRE